MFWKTGYEKLKKVYSTTNVDPTSYDDARQTSIFGFCDGADEQIRGGLFIKNPVKNLQTRLVLEFRQR